MKYIVTTNKNLNVFDNLNEATAYMVNFLNSNKKELNNVIDANIFSVTNDIYSKHQIAKEIIHYEDYDKVDSYHTALENQADKYYFTLTDITEKFNDYFVAFERRKNEREEVIRFKHKNTPIIIEMYVTIEDEEKEIDECVKNGKFNIKIKER